MVTFPPFFARNHPRGQKRGESDEGGVQQQQKNGEGKTEKLKMFLIQGEGVTGAYDLKRP